MVVSDIEDASDAEFSASRNEPVKFNLSSETFLTRRKTHIADEGTGREGEPEDTVDTWYVDFAGPTFAYLTEGHELPVLNAYLSGQPISGRIPLRSVENLREGDYVMFRESGDSDIIRFLAEDEIGKERYGRLRMSFQSMANNAPKTRLRPEASS